MVRMSMARPGSHNHIFHIVCMRGPCVRKDWPPMSGIGSRARMPTLLRVCSAPELPAPAIRALLPSGHAGRTGFPIAKVAAKLAIGYTLDEIANDITGGATPAWLAKLLTSSTCLRTLGPPRSDVCFG
jgi:hypothetical protein